MSSGQLSLDLPAQGRGRREDLCISPANAQAIEWIDMWPAWPVSVLVLHGPRGCGKSHMAGIWREKADAITLPVDDLSAAMEKAHEAIAAGRRVLLDDADMVHDQVALFHLINSVKEAVSSLLLTGRTAPAHWPFDLPDLRSRLNAAQIVGISEPDDALLKSVLAKLFADRQLRVADNVLDYLALRIDRSFQAANDIVDRLDQEALNRRRAVTRDLARQVLE